MRTPLTTEQMLSKWQSVLDDDGFRPIADRQRRSVVATLMENTTYEQKQADQSAGMITESDALQVNTSGDLQGDRKGYNPILISLIRRSMPNLVAYDICGVQPMTGPTGLVFALRPKYIDKTGPTPALGDDAFYNEAETDFSGTGTHAGNSPAVLNDATPGAYTAGTGKTTADGEVLGTAGNPEFAEMGFSLDKMTVTAQTRALKAEFTTELAQDLRNIHGLDAETELSNILTAEILAEINREILRDVYVIAKPGAQNTDLATTGTFDLDVDSNGRWAVEKFKGLLFQIERDANQVAKETRRGKANIIICSSDVASALALAGVLDYAPALQGSTSMEVDDTGNTFAGILNGRYRVYIDPYAVNLSDGSNFYVVGYRGQNPYDAGYFYCPYVPLQMYRAVGPDSFQPKIGFKTRYGKVMNPFAKGTNAPSATGAPEANSNVYYRRVKVTNLTGTAI